jgi:hypothetical protein
MTFAAKTATALIMIAVMPAAFLAQAKRSTKPKNKAVTTAAMPQPAPESTPKTTPSSKRNERPGDSDAAQAKPTSTPQPPSYFYQFDRPGFTYPSIAIEHDEAGRGRITFVREGNDIAVSDPIELSPVTLAKIKDAFAALNFLDSADTYQTPRDHSNMGNVTITLKREGRSRTAKFNWSDNKDARALADEYRRIANEYTWRFEITSARENQPLLAPQLMLQMSDYLSRNEISDPTTLVPFLQALSNDERIPLIARDKAGKIVEQISKAKNR